jgi:hypothetical protein
MLYDSDFGSRYNILRSGEPARLSHVENSSA